jgi:hypothetical protein
MRCEGYVPRMEEKRTHENQVVRSKGKRLLTKPKHKGEDNIKGSYGSG